MRQMIYEQTFIVPGILRSQDETITQSTHSGEAVHRTDTPLLENQTKNRSRDIYRKQHLLPEDNTTALLRTCRTIYNEGIQIFYRKNRFRFPALAGGIGPIIAHQPFLSYVRNVSIDYTYSFPELWLTKLGDQADSTIASCIVQLSNQCPALREFSLHVPSISALPHLVELARQGRSATVLIMRTLKLRLDRMSIIAAGFSPEFSAVMGQVFPRFPLTVLFDFCTSIAPEEEWIRETCGSWPEPSMPAKRFYYDRFEGAHLDGSPCICWRIWRWHMHRSAVETVDVEKIA
ncbi:hypothetical protein MMC28_000936 [Mycoblastus sanguinarius]|nr:hypothetical protein [Mycoblastus sanguinarius]